MTAVGAVREAGTPSAPSAPRRIPRPRLMVTAREVTGVAAVAVWSVAVLGGMAVWSLVFAFVLSGLQEQHGQARLYATIREQLAAGTAPIGGVIARGRPIAVLDAPAAGLSDLVVVEGTTSADLRSGPGHYPGTALPGQPGVSTVFGRATTFGAPFSHVARLHRGDLLTAVTGQGTFTYRVTGVRHAGDPISAVLPAGGSQLTLVTSEGSGWRTGWAPSRAVFADAALVGKTQPTSGGRVTALTADGVMRTDVSGLYPLVLWLLLLVGASAALSWTRLRWGRWQSWLIGVPIVLAALWGASDSAWTLLPNLF